MSLCKGQYHLPKGRHSWRGIEKTFRITDLKREERVMVISNERIHAANFIFNQRFDMDLF
jgi:hypothetical protein